MSGGDGAHPVSDACDYARHCSSLDFFSINDHAVTLTPRRWSETIEAIRQCNDIAHDPSNPDLVAYLGWEWTQVGATPETHWGHKNVIVRGGRARVRRLSERARGRERLRARRARS